MYNIVGQTWNSVEVAILCGNITMPTMAKSSDKKPGRPRHGETVKKPITVTLREDTIAKVRELVDLTKRNPSIEIQVALDFYFAYRAKHKITLPIDLAGGLEK